MGSIPDHLLDHDERINRPVWRMAAKYMRRGFDGLLALAEERSGLR
jgi:hypothetical protein